MVKESRCKTTGVWRIGAVAGRHWEVAASRSAPTVLTRPAFSRTKLTYWCTRCRRWPSGLSRLSTPNGQRGNRNLRGRTARDIFGSGARTWMSRSGCCRHNHRARQVKPRNRLIPKLEVRDGLAGPACGQPTGLHDGRRVAASAADSSRDWGNLGWRTGLLRTVPPAATRALGGPALRASASSPTSRR